MGTAENFNLLQFIGNGNEGDSVVRMIEERLGTSSRSSSSSCTVRTAAPCRTCISLVTASSTTEIVEPSGAVSTAEVSQLLQKLDSVGKVHGLAVMGSMPPGCEEDLYAAIIAKSCDAQSKVKSSVTQGEVD